ncbi:NADH:flavin oxidoreductase [Nocardioides sp. Kera G14]|uniref:NADH:flavin oxidoreductase n=1 Tax=Nocardioides sp. Kera G14 TaxID=2884264 RepID=UPI001D122B24|nr:NADH:flavin oxidoreductase [Nocardioides sp. Kera G14]UDY22217.1 NADH:flavin oxidoreductase [Nocardioides sp. Kera G14]
MTDPAPDVLAPATLGPVQLRNRVIKSATFEGASPEALVSDRLIDYHLAVAEGGVGMTTVAYLAVSPEGRTHAEQIWWRPEALYGLRRLTEAVHATGAKVSAQIGHAGPVANGQYGHPSLAPSRSFNPLAMRFHRAPTETDIDRIVADHGEATRMAIEAGFDAVEVHLGHNYLASAFLSPKLNRRKDAFGGSLVNRAEFPRRILAAVRRAAGDQIAVTAKLNMKDGYRGGFDIPDSIPFARMLEADGHLDALELTGGSSLMNPMYLFRGGAPVKEMATNMPMPALLRLGIRAVGKGFFKEYPWEPLYFLEYAKKFRTALSMPIILLGGITDRAAMDTAMAEGFDFVAMGRALLREPDLINRIAATVDSGAPVVSKCIHCNLCMSTIYPGTHCHLDDEHVYGTPLPIHDPLLKAGA